jgi:hypothetical protein
MSASLRQLLSNTVSAQQDDRGRVEVAPAVGALLDVEQVVQLLVPVHAAPDERLGRPKADRVMPRSFKGSSDSPWAGLARHSSIGWFLLSVDVVGTVSIGFSRNSSTIGKFCPPGIELCDWRGDPP